MEILIHITPSMTKRERACFRWTKRGEDDASKSRQEVIDDENMWQELRKGNIGIVIRYWGNEMIC